MSEAEDGDGRQIPQIATVALQTVGCKLNQAESESLARRLVQAGYHIVSPDANHDVYLLNTCTVTHNADRKCRHLLRLAHRRNPKALIIASGCYAQRDAEELGRIEGVTLVVGNEDKERLLDIIGAMGARSGQDQSTPRFRNRAMVKIQDGCSQHCSYCIVPRVRGRERDVDPDQVLADVRTRIAEGHREIVLTGTQIGGYGGDGELEGLVQRILAETDVPRLRLSSIQPQDLSPSFLRLWRDSRLCRHLHLALQSGSDAVLRRMRRCYSVADYEHAVNMAREAIPGLAITTDIMVGFPGESDEEFEESILFCQRIGFARLHVFPYSERPGTTAARMTDKVDERTKRLRNQQMLKLAQGSAQQFQSQFLGLTLPVLWEQERDGIWSGLSDNYIRVFTQSEQPLTDQLLPARLAREHASGLWGVFDNQ